MAPLEPISVGMGCLAPHIWAMMDKTERGKRRRPVRDDGWRLPDELWARMEPLLPPRPAHRRFQDWARAGVFEAFWREGVLAYDRLAGIDWTWMALDAAMGKAPLGGGKNRPQPNRPGQAREQALGAE